MPFSIINCSTMSVMLVESPAGTSLDSFHSKFLSVCDILVVRSCVDMSRAHTSGGIASVTVLFIGRHRPVGQFVREGMGRDDEAAFDFELPVPVLLDVPSPNPAGAKFGTCDGNRPVFIDLLPEARLGLYSLSSRNQHGKIISNVKKSVKLEMHSRCEGSSSFKPQVFI